MKQNIVYLELKKSFKSIDTYCKKKTALPAFESVPGEKLRNDFKDMCKADDATDSYADAVAGFGEGMLTNLEACLQFHEAPAEAQQEFLDKGEPSGLRPLETGFASSEYYDKYLKDWKADGKFLNLLALLTGHIEILKKKMSEAEIAQGKAIEERKKHLALQKQTFTDLQLKIKEKLDAGVQLANAKETAQAAAESVEKATANMDQLKKAFDDAVSAWKAAQELFKKMHKTGTLKV